MAREMDRSMVVSFAMAAVMGITAGKQLSGKRADPKDIAKEAVDIGIAAEKEIRTRLYIGD